jgi:predicted AlkP superfamily pyrophosphatase or phosphodiesterase
VRRSLRFIQSSKASRIAKFTAIHAVIIAAFLALLYGAYHATSHSKTLPPPAHIAQRLSNGTHIFAPTTLLISLDGFRADFLTRNLTPTLNSFIREGVSPKYMLPSFPSLTFPNHFTLVTGLHPESHGVVGNTFWDPDTMKEFYYTDPERSMQPEWWKAEPLWLTAELQGVRTAIHMWPGSEAHIGSMEPAYVDEFKEDEGLSRKVERIFHWLDLPGSEDAGVKADDARPQFIAAYVPNVDTDGHKYGPNSTYRWMGCWLPFSKGSMRGT